MNRIILADPSIPSPIPSDQGSPSSVAPETPIGSGTLPIIPSIQPLNSRTPEDDFYDIHWNPVWEPSKEDIPITPPGVSAIMSSSDMDETTLVTSEEELMSSGEIPLPMEGFPFHIAPLGVTFPLLYHALSDIMSSMSLNSSSMCRNFE